VSFCLFNMLSVISYWMSFFLSVTIMSVILLSVIILNVILLCVILFSVVMLNVIMLIVVAPSVYPSDKRPFAFSILKWYHQTNCQFRQMLQPLLYLTVLLLKMLNIMLELNELITDLPIFEHWELNKPWSRDEMPRSTFDRTAIDRMVLDLISGPMACVIKILRS
jgi:hypothetical protein